MAERPVCRDNINGHLAQQASDFLVDLLVKHPKLKQWFASEELSFSGLKTPAEVFEKLEEIDLDDDQKKVIGYCVAICTPNLRRGHKKISPLGTLLRKSLEMHPRFPIPEDY